MNKAQIVGVAVLGSFFAVMFAGSVMSHGLAWAITIWTVGILAAALVVWAIGLIVVGRWDAWRDLL